MSAITVTPFMAGKAAPFGVIGTVLWTGFLATVNKLTKAGLQSGFEVVDALDGVGNIVSTAATKKVHTLSVECLPFDPTNPSSLATAYASIVEPPPLSIVTIANFGNGLYDGNWNYVGGFTSEMVEGQYLKVGMNLRRVGDTPAAQALAVT